MSRQNGSLSQHHDYKGKPRAKEPRKENFHFTYIFYDIQEFTNSWHNYYDTTKLYTVRREIPKIVKKKTFSIEKHSENKN